MRLPTFPLTRGADGGIAARAQGKLSFEAVQQMATEELLEKYIENRCDTPNARDTLGGRVHDTGHVHLMHALSRDHVI